MSEAVWVCNSYSDEERNCAKDLIESEFIDSKRYNSTVSKEALRICEKYISEGNTDQLDEAKSILKGWRDSGENYPHTRALRRAWINTRPKLPSERGIIKAAGAVH